MAKKGTTKIKTKKIKNNLKMEDFDILYQLLEQKLQENTAFDPSSIPKDAVLVDELDRTQALTRIDDLMRQLINQINEYGQPYFDVPSRTAKNIVYDEKNEMLLLGKATSRKNLLSLTSVEDSTRLIRVIELIYELLQKDIHASKREIFYGDVNLFKEQTNSDKSIEDASTILHTIRNSTHVIASAKGEAIGRVRIKDKNDIIDLEALGSGGWSITPMLDNVEIIESDAEFILVLEKDAAKIRLAEVRYWRKYPCIILTGKGAADIATRMFLKKLHKSLKIPILSLVDADPYGHYIHSVYLRGSKRLSYESPFLATPDIKLLGVLSKDLDEYRIPESCRIPMNKMDMKRLDELLKEEFVANNKAWREDLEIMKQMKVKAEIQALSAHGFEFLTESYLPNKIESGDWI